MQLNLTQQECLPKLLISLKFIRETKIIIKGATTERYFSYSTSVCTARSLAAVAPNLL